jgi:lipopolysaccharide/colanic/teichoic acid biosynthesis glycosyltransferase
MRVLLIHQAFATPAESGGTRHYEIGRILAERGNRITAVRSRVEYQTGLPTPEHRPPAGMTLLGAPAHYARSGNFISRLISFLSFTLSSMLRGALVRDLDVVWGTSPPIFQALSGYIVARFRRVPYVLEIRDLWPDFAVQTGVLRNPALIKMSRLLESFLYRSADRLIINSPGFKDHLIERGASPDKITLVANGTDTGLFENADGALVRTELGIGDRFAVLYAGAHGLANNLDMMLEAADILRADERIVFVLIGDGRMKAYLERRAADMELPNVIFADSRPKDGIPDVLAASDVCVAVLKPIPMFDTTYPNKVFDYMAASKPTLLAIDGQIRQVIEAAGGGTYVDPVDPSALAAAVSEYASDPQRVVDEGRAARHYVVANFDRRKQALLAETTLLEAVKARAMTGRIGAFAKRFIDIAGSLVGLSLLVIPFLMIALLIRIDSPGSVWFRFKRVGRHGKSFLPWKFRTMVQDAPDKGPGLLNMTQGDARITRIGHFLRASGIDELPQLINVLKGEMSLVGPRPTLRYQIDAYTNEQLGRLRAKPGIAGLAVIKGRNSLAWEDRITIDNDYIDNWSFWIDIRILLVTPWKILVARDGLYGPEGDNYELGEATDGEGNSKSN